MIKFSKRNQAIKITDNEEHKFERLGFFFLSPLILLLALEVMHLTYPGSLRISISVYYVIKMAITYLFLLSTQSLFYGLTLGNDFLACTVNSILYFMLSYANEVLAKITGDPILPTDFLLIGALKEITGFARIPIYSSAIVALGTVILSIRQHRMICKKTKKIFKGLKKVPVCILGIAFGLVCLYNVSINYNFRYRVLSKVNVQIRAFNPIEDYTANGLVLTFFPRIGDAIIKAPENYSEAEMDRIEKQYSGDFIPANEEAVHPNVIIIQNEAFWDPTLLEGVEYSSDPMWKIRQLSEEYPSGYMFSPVFAGGTCMPEFECLTGMSTMFIDSITYPYIQHVTSKTRSIVSVYKDAGYSTVAIHPYKKHFYGRNTAYPLLGFDEFIGEEDMQKVEMSGWYISDASAMDEIIYQYENKKKERIFQFCVTMQNHGAYSGGRYPSTDVEIRKSPLNAVDAGGLQDYVQGVYDADKQFIRLINYFRSEDEPTLIVMYGDHLPLLGTEGSTYMDTGFVEKKDSFEYYKYPQLFKTPYIVWANYDISDFEISKFTSPANIGLTVLQNSNIGMPWYLKMFKGVYEEYPVYQGNAIMNKNYQGIGAIEEKDKPMFEDYKLIQFDLLDGENYILKKEEQ